MSRILTWYFGNRDEQPSYYMERDYTLLDLRIMAEIVPVGDGLSIDIRADGVSVLTDSANLPKGQTIEPYANDFPEETVISEGAVVTCHVLETNGANKITVQLEMESIE